MKMTFSKVDWVILAGLIAVVFWIMTRPLAVCVLRENPDVYRQSMLRSLITAMNNYSDEFEGQLFSADQWHETMDPWLGITPDDPIYFVNDTNEIYLLPMPWDTLQLPESISTEELQAHPFMFENPALQKDFTSVSFWDGSVRSLTDDEFTELIDMKLGIPLGVVNP